jgi:hypothetical protein
MIDDVDPLRVIQERFAAGDYVATMHFVEEMRNDRLFWADILAAVDGASEAIDDGSDAQGDPKYRVPGLALDGRGIEVVCVVKGPIVLVTVYTIEGDRP